MRVDWQVFQAGGYRAEAQIFRAVGADARRALLFCPGFPGMGATLFEQRHAGVLAQAGYDVFVIKHKGIRLDSPSGPAMVNSSARLAQGVEAGERCLGGGVASIDDWLGEPFAVLDALAGRYDAVDVIGNSFGALSALWSLTMEGAPSGRVGSLLLYAGAQGIADDTPQSIMRIWKPEYMTVPRITDKVMLEDAKAIEARLKDVYKELPERVRARLPGHVRVTCLVVEKDEILAMADTERFNAAIGGRAKVVVDTVDCAWPDYGLLAHDTPNYRAGDLLGLLGLNAKTRSPEEGVC
jgi:pimeloyl-ACP methyl ester carboxylesterase